MKTYNHSNAHQELARRRKAEKLARFAATQGIDGGDLEHFDDEGWRVLAMAAGANPPSTETRALVLRLYIDSSRPSSPAEHMTHAPGGTP